MDPSRKRLGALLLAGIAVASLVAAGAAAIAGRGGQYVSSGASPSAGSPYFGDDAAAGVYHLVLPRLPGSVVSLDASWTGRADVLVVPPDHDSLARAIRGELPAGAYARFDGVESFSVEVPLPSVRTTDRDALVVDLRDLAGRGALGRATTDELVLAYDRAAAAVDAVAIVWRFEEPRAEPGDLQAKVRAEYSHPVVVAAAWTFLGLALVAVVGAVVLLVRRAEPAPADAAEAGSLEGALRRLDDVDRFVAGVDRASAGFGLAFVVVAAASLWGFSMLLSSGALGRGAWGATVALTAALLAFATIASAFALAAWTSRVRGFREAGRAWRARYEQVGRDRLRFLEEG